MAHQGLFNNGGQFGQSQFGGGAQGAGAQPGVVLGNQVGQHRGSGTGHQAKAPPRYFQTLDVVGGVKRQYHFAGIAGDQVVEQFDGGGAQVSVCPVTDSATQVKRLSSCSRASNHNMRSWARPMCISTVSLSSGKVPAAAMSRRRAQAVGAVQFGLQRRDTVGQRRFYTGGGQPQQSLVDVGAQQLVGRVEVGGQHGGGLL